jgi:hypothetical protein
MVDQDRTDSRIHDLFGAFMGALAAGILISTPWQVDTTGPDPFYKGPLIYPLLALGIMLLSSLPFAWRLSQSQDKASWMLDGAGFPIKPMCVLIFLIMFLAGLVVIGLRISCMLFLGGSLYALGHRSLSVLVLIPIIVTGIIYMLFKFFLDIYFPSPLILDWLWN